MARTLDSGRRAAASGKAASAVVFLHGYGADGADLLGLADPLAAHLPETAFLAPDAPERCANNPLGRQWFPVPWLDGSSEEEAVSSMRRSVEDLDAFLDAALEAEGVMPSRTALFGFSQGTMMSLHVAPRRGEALAGVVGFSGRLLAPERLKGETVSRPPILLAHGDRDEMVPPQSMPEAAEALAAAGFDVVTHVMKGQGHGISPDGLSIALAFIREKLGVG